MVRSRTFVRGLPAPTCGVRSIGTRPKLHGRYGPALRRGTRGDPSRQSLHYPIRQWPPALTVSLRPSSSNTFGGYAHQEARHHALCLAGLAATIRTTSRSISICQWREPLAWEGESAHLTASLPALAGGRSPDRTRDQRSPHPTWDSAPSDDLWTEACGKERWLRDDGNPRPGNSPRLRRQALAVSCRGQQVSC